MNSLKMTIVLLSCIAMIVAVNAMAMDKDSKYKAILADLVQRPIFYNGETRSNNRKNGEVCQYSFDCNSGCCLQVKGDRTGRRCGSKGRKDDRCSVSQLKVDVYMDFCPCEKGNKYCTGEEEPRCAA